HCPGALAAQRVRGAREVDQRAPAVDPPPTVIVTSAFVDSAPSFAVTRSTYVPRSLNRTVVSAFPFSTATGPPRSTRAFAGPRSCIQVTVRPRGRGDADEFACA